MGDSRTVLGCCLWLFSRGAPFGKFLGLGLLLGICLIGLKKEDVQGFEKSRLTQRLSQAFHTLKHKLA